MSVRAERTEFVLRLPMPGGPLPWFFSIVFHGCLLALFLHYHQTAQKSLKLLTNVELIEPASPEAVETPQVPRSRSLWEFVKLAVSRNEPVALSGPSQMDDARRTPALMGAPEKLTEARPMQRTGPAIKIDEGQRMARAGPISDFGREAPERRTSGILGASNAAPLKDAARAPGRASPSVFGREEPLRMDDSGLRRRPAPVEPAPRPQETRAQAPRSVDTKKKAVELTGPLSGRKIVATAVPAFPEWARARGIEAAVSIRFFVSPLGEVRDGAEIVNSSGYGEIDRSALTALAKWKFAPAQIATDQWGIVTFRYLLE